MGAPRRVGRLIHPKQHEDTSSGFSSTVVGCGRAYTASSSSYVIILLLHIILYGGVRYSYHRVYVYILYKWFLLYYYTCILFSVVIWRRGESAVKI